MTAKKPEIDWERIELDYRAGILSTREIATANNISHTLINRRAKAEGWEKDLSARIKAKAEALVSRQLVSEEVSIAKAATEREVVAAGAERIAQVRGMQRGDITQARALAMRLLAELRHQTENNDLYQQLGELLIDPVDEDDSASAQARQNKRREIFEKAMSLGGRTKTMKDLADTLKTLIALEREAYDIAPVGAGAPPQDPLASAITDNDKARRLLFAVRQAVDTLKE